MRRWVLGALTLLLSACEPGAGGPRFDGDGEALVSDSFDPIRSESGFVPETTADLEEALDLDGRVEAILELRLASPSIQTGTVAPADNASATEAAAAFEARYHHAGVHVLHRYRHAPLLHVEIVRPTALQAVLVDPGLAGVYPNRAHRPDLAQSLALIDQPEAAALGKTGTGTAVAIIDTGVNYTNAAFGTCSTPGDSGCKIAASIDTADTDNAMDDNGHGTHVTATALAVAPGAKAVVIDAFVAANNGVIAYTNDILEAMDWVISNRTTYNIVSLNLSLGSDSTFTPPCGLDPFAAMVGSLTSNGISVVAASGNKGETAQLASPACVPDVVSVGAVYDFSFTGTLNWNICTDTNAAPDKVACFSNAASTLSLLAPGVLVNAAGVTMSGTSMASPHVAGAVAVLKSAFPSETPADMLGRLSLSGQAVLDSRNNLTKPRIDLDNALGACITGVSPSQIDLTNAGGSVTVNVTTSANCPWTPVPSAAWISVSPSTMTTGSGSFTVNVSPGGSGPRNGQISLSTVTIPVSQGADLEGPTGSIQIGNGATFTNNRLVSLALSASDLSGVATMCISLSSTCTNFVPFATSSTINLAATNGVQSVFVKFKDTVGNVSTYFDVITLDTVRPTDGPVTVDGTSTTLTLTATGFNDSGSGLAAYRIVQGTTAPPADCAGTPIYEGSSGSATISGLTLGALYHFRMCAVDAAGNVSAGVAVSKTVRTEQTSPTPMKIEINANATYTTTTAVTLTLEALDNVAVTGMCISNTTSCTAWLPYSTSKAWSLTAGSAVKTVFVKFRDNAGNESGLISDTISFDNTGPTGGSITGLPGDQHVTLALAPMTDTPAGVAEYKVVFAEGTVAPANCNSGTTVPGVPSLFTAATSVAQQGLVNGRNYSYRFCGRDNFGNWSTGLTTTSKAASELVAPNPVSITVNANAVYTTTTTVTLTLSATDNTAVTEMCLSNSTTCTAWIPYATTASWTLATGTGTRTVYARFRDASLNTSANISDAILLDGTGPTSGTLTATPGNNSVTLNIANVTDTPAGVASMKLVFAAGTTPPANCNAGTTILDNVTPITTHTHTGLTNGTSYAYRLCALDAYGNANAGSTVVSRAASELIAPTQTSVIINDNAVYTKTTTVSLTLAAMDPSGVTQMCVSTTTSCASYEAFASTRSFTVAAGSAGTRTVYAFFRDSQGNTSVAVSDSIVFDATLPVNGTLATTLTGADVSLSGTGFSDPGSGIDRYKVVYASTTAPASCSVGTVLHEGTQPTATHVAPSTGTWAYRMCAFDKAGNLSTGATKTIIVP